MIAAIIFVFWTIARRRVPATGPLDRAARAAVAPRSRSNAAATAGDAPPVASRRRAQVRTLNASQARYEQEQHKEERGRGVAMKAGEQKKKDRRGARLRQSLGLCAAELRRGNGRSDRRAGLPSNRVTRGARLAALRDAAKRKRGDAPPTTKRIRVTRDARGDEQLELDGDPSVGASRVVMMRWEKPYMEARGPLDVGADDAVLEVGYGLGFSAARVAAARPRRHVIAECEKESRRARAGFEVAATTWQAFLARPPTDSYTRVFFDDFPIVAADAGDASRWRTFLRAVTPHLAAGARVTGYAADEALLRASLPGGFALESAAAFACEPPPDCPYLAPGAGDALVVPVVVFNTI
ncbi:protein-arginine N5-methyltransferase [Aureococcus anophagefferens]|nr:protein-arginine N5-methyltransferase [Aureococcus anophagefferens]